MNTTTIDLTTRKPIIQDLPLYNRIQLAREKLNELGNQTCCAQEPTARKLLNQAIALLDGPEYPNYGTSNEGPLCANCHRPFKDNHVGDGNDCRKPYQVYTQWKDPA